MSDETPDITEAACDREKIKELISIVDSDITNTINFLDHLKVDNFALSATVLGLMGVIGFTLLKELLIYWILASMLLISLILLKFFNGTIPTKKFQQKMQNVLDVLGQTEEQQVRLLIEGVIILKNSKHLLKSIALIFLTDLIIIGFSYTHLVDIANVGFFTIIIVSLIFLMLIVVTQYAEQIGLILTVIVVSLGCIHHAKKDETNGNIFSHKNFKLFEFRCCFPSGWTFIFSHFWRNKHDLSNRWDVGKYFKDFDNLICPNCVYCHFF